MAKILIKLTEEQFEQIKRLANLEDEPVTAYIKNIILEKVEDEQDYKDAIQARKEINGKVYSEREVMKELFDK